MAIPGKSFNAKDVVRQAHHPEQTEVRRRTKNAEFILNTDYWLLNTWFILTGLTGFTGLVQPFDSAQGPDPVEGRSEVRGQRPGIRNH